MNPAPAPPEGIARAPLLFLLGTVYTALILGDENVPIFAAALASALFCFSLVMIFSGFRPPNFLPYTGGIVLLALLISLLSLWRVHNFSVSPGPVKDGGTVILERSWGARRGVIVEGKGGRFLLKVRPNQSVREGESLSFTGEAVAFRGRGESSFREDLYWRARGVSGEIVPEKVLPKRVSSFSMASFRTALRRSILLSLPPQTRGYLLAALVGAKDPELAEDHRAWGTAHLLAVSGFHVGLAAVFIWKFLSSRFLGGKISPRGRILGASAALWCYAFLAGGAPSALRAALMIQAALMGKLLGRRGRPVNAVSLAALILLLWRPEWYADLGWRLSVTAALLLASLAERGGRWRTALAASPLVWLATYPLTSSVFGPTPLSGVAVNLAALPVFALLFPLGALLSIPALMGLPGGFTLAGAAEGLFILWQWGADLMAKLLPWSVPWHWGLELAGRGVFFALLAAGLFPLGWRLVTGILLALLAAGAFL